MGVSCRIPNCQWIVRLIRKRFLHPFLVLDYFRECNSNGIDEFQCVALEVAIVSCGLTIDVPIIQPYVRSLIFDNLDLDISLLASQRIFANDNQPYRFEPSQDYRKRQRKIRCK